MKQFDLIQQEDLAKINAALDEALALEKNPYDEVLEAMRYSVMNAGKRVRPILVLEFCRALGGNPDQALAFACAVEMIHCYSLIHDDLPCMDNDDLRRGKPSCHKQFGESTALLAGDGLLTKAFEKMADAPLGKINPRAVLSCIQELSYYAGVNGMIGGQVLDLQLEEETDRATVALLEQVHDLKTAALLKASCEMGALCAGADADGVLLAELYGEHLGLAFQITDDILDQTGEEVLLGKPIGSDEKNGKATVVSLCGLEEAQRMAGEQTDKALDVLRRLPEHEFLEELTLRLLKRDH